MKSILSVVISMLAFFEGNAQYYYKDLLVPRQAGQQLQLFRQQKVRSVTLTSYEGDGQPTENFEGSQRVDAQTGRITTSLRSALSGSSQLTSSFDASGRLVKTTDTTDGSSSTTSYQYNERNEMTAVINLSLSAGSHREKEEHYWRYQDGKPESMLRIKDYSDTTYMKFVLDEKGNVAEENGMRKGVPLPSYYYYYDALGRLTDIVSYNIKARRLLPDYVFEYNEDGSLKTMMVVPEGSSDYQKWYYEYHNLLKAGETVFNKKKQLLGKIEYRYE